MRPNHEFLTYPRPDDVRLIVEVSATTLAGDLTTKAGLYARAGIPEYWVLDVDGRRLRVHRGPGTEGYTDVSEYAENESVMPLTTTTAVAVIDLLP